MNDPNEQREGYRETKVGWIPEEWDCVKLGEILDISSGGTPSRKEPDYWNGNIPWITTSHVSNCKIFQTDELITDNGLKSSSARWVEIGTVILAMYGQGKTRGQVGILGIRATINQACAALKWKGDGSNPFLFQSLRRRYTALRNFSNSGGQENLSAELLRCFPIPLPPLPEQEKIATILSTWDDGLEHLDALIKVKTRQKTALMQQLLTGKTRLPGFKEEWDTVQLSSILRHIFRPIEWHENTLFDLVSIRRRAGGLFRRGLTKGSDYKTKDLHRIQAGDLLISKRQVTHGALSVVTEKFEGGIVSKEYSIFENIAPEKLHMPFLNWLTKEKRFWWICFVASNGVDIEKLIFSPTDFLKATISLPPTIEEQTAIAKILTTAETEITLLKAKQTALQQQKKSLMQKLLTGQVRVTI